MGYNPTDVYKYMPILDVITYALNDNNVKCVSSGKDLVLVKDFLPDGTPVWRKPKEGEHLDEI